jgi:hypothetical protein
MSPLDQRYSHPQEPRPSSLQEHGRSIVAGILIIVLAAAVLSAFSSVREPICDLLGIDPCTKIDPNDEMFGTWDFVSSNPDPLPQTLPGVTPELYSLVLSKDQTFIADGAQVMDDGTSLPFRSTGTFEAVSSNEIQMYGGEEGSFQGTNRLSFEGANIMHMIDASTGFEVTWSRRL